MKILIIAPYIKLPDVSGAAVHYIEFAKALAALGIEVHILAYSKKEIRLGGKIFLHPSNYSEMPPKRFWTSLKSIKRAIDICKKHHIEVIHDRCDVGQILGYIIAKVSRLPRVSELNENPLAYEIKESFVRDILVYPFLFLFKKFWASHIAPDANVVTTVSKTIRESMINLGISPEKIVAIPNGSNPEFLGKPLSLKKFGIRKGESVSVVIGELGPRQGIMELVQSIKNLNIPNFKLLLVGGEERYAKYLSKVKNFVHENNLSGKVIFVPRIEHDKIKNFLASVDFALAPYRESWNKESFGFCPLKILGYMAAGKVVIASNTKWIRELIDDKKDGFLIPFETFGENMEKIINSLSPQKRKLVQLSARKKIIQKFNWDNVAKQYKKIYESLI